MRITVSALGVVGAIVGGLFWGPFGAAVGYGVGQTVRFDWWRGSRTEAAIREVSRSH